MVRSGWMKISSDIIRIRFTRIIEVNECLSQDFEAFINFFMLLFLPLATNYRFYELVSW